MNSLAQQLVVEAMECGVRLEPRPNRGLYVEPVDRLTVDLRERLVAHKPEIIDYLRQQVVANPLPSEPEPVPTEQVAEVEPVEIFGSAVALVEVRGFPVRLLAGLPCPPSLICDLPPSETVVFDFRRLYNHKAHGRPHFDLSEVRELIRATEAGWPFDFRAACRRKVSDPGWRLRFKDLPGEQPGIPLNTAQFLARLGVKLRVIELRPQG
jgi:hypothetical protein